ncbi:hypothetical protein CEXT_43841 [Caerostris extrusa]|uniref:Uncharacterized protein n=1 Tax=Caerostris extrusa TaxID=172846 RepID=A0AAV4Y0F6_CAEEX|nr:hypothetical protein CEXT_43841 [Caerostris extrusa]
MQITAALTSKQLESEPNPTDTPPDKPAQVWFNNLRSSMICTHKAHSDVIRRLNSQKAALVYVDEGIAQRCVFELGRRESP